MKALKIAGIAFGALVVLALAGMAFVASQFDAAHIKGELARVVKEKKQRTLKIDGELELSFWPSVGVKLGKLSLSERNSDKVFAAVDAARVAVAVMPLLSKRIDVNAIDINGVKATVIKHKDGTLNIDDLMSSDKSESQPLQLDIGSIKIANVALTWHDEQAGSTTEITGLEFTTGRLQADTGRKTFQTDAITFGAALTGAEQTIRARLKLSGVDGTAQALKVAGLAFDVDAKFGATAVKGALNSALAVDLEHTALALDKFSGEFEIANPAMPMKQVKLPISGALHADLSKSVAGGHLATQFDESKIAFKFDVTKFTPLALAFDLDIDRLNVDKYMPPQKAAAGEKRGEEDKLDFSALKGLNLNGSVRIGSLQMANVKASNIKLQLRAANGKLDIAPQAANLYDGSLSGSLSLDANGNALAMKESLVGININPLLKDAIDKDLIEGRGSVALDISSRGTSVAAMKHAMNGSASLALKDGAIKGINLAQTFREMKAKFSSRQDAAQQAKASDKTDFSELSASFHIANGVAHNEDLSAKSPFLRLGGAGDIDIGNSSMNYLAKASVVATSGGQGAQDLEYLKGLTIPVRLAGPFDNLSYKIELASLANEAVKAKVEEKKQEIQQQAKDKLLKGLFGR